MKRVILIVAAMLVMPTAGAFSKCQIGFTTLYKKGPCPKGTEVPVEDYGGFSSLDIGGLSVKIKIDEMARRAEEIKLISKAYQDREAAQRAQQLRAAEAAKKTLTDEMHESAQRKLQH